METKSVHFLLEIDVYFMCMCVQPACMYVNHVHTVPTVPEEITGSPEMHCGCWEMDPGSLQEQQVLFIFMCMGALSA